MSGNPISRRVVPVVSGGIPLTSIRALHLLPLFRSGKVAQLVEQRTENPCVPGSIPGLATSLRRAYGWQASHKLTETLCRDPSARRRLRAVGLAKAGIAAAQREDARNHPSD